MEMYVETPMIVRESSQGYQSYNILDEMLLHREVECVGEINAVSVYSLCRQLRHLQRDILPHGRVMIHDPLIGKTGGNALQLYEISQGLMQTREHMGQLLAQFTGRTLEEIYEKTKRDTFFDAEEAVAFGLADRVIETIWQWEP